MWIICAGAKRSGSTLQYNMLARLVESTGAGFRIGHFKPEDFEEIYDQYKSSEGFKIVKLHTPPDNVFNILRPEQTIVFHCYRDIRDVVVSYINKGWMENNSNNIQECVLDYLSQLDLWKSRYPEMITRKYENFVDNLENELKEYAQALQIQLNEDQFSNIARELNIETVKNQQDKINPDKLKSLYSNEFDAETLVHKNHINDGSTGQFFVQLELEEIARIEALAQAYLQEVGYELYCTNDSFVSFSQHADDFIAWQLLGKKNSGLVVEIGAFDGVHLSNSFGLEKRGWQSVCVEPNPKIFAYLTKHRPKAINYNCAAVSDPKLSYVEFYSEEIGVLSGLEFDEADVKRRYENRGLEYKAPDKLQVAAKTFDQILVESDLTNQIIDVVSIDVEGFELEVLRGLDLNKHRVALFIIEANDLEHQKEILEYFENFSSYCYIGSNYQNLFIVNSKLIKRKNLKNLNFENYIKAPQRHPVSDSLTIDSIIPEFKSTHELDRLTRRFKLF